MVTLNIVIRIPQNFDINNTNTTRSSIGTTVSGGSGQLILLVKRGIEVPV